MFLISLDIFGFKSFADKTHIEFADGITALLGPNGCGKSNVVDAIKWVLGEQRSASMRAEKMEDVIFAGCESRRQLNVAEVTLKLANENGLLPRDETEVEIRRRLYRSGESEYFINSHEAKLKDIRQLFWDTGVGKGAYSVMEQGKIDQALSSKPEERRYIFEEAAGITKNKAQSHEAELKLARTEDNMRILDVQVKETKRSFDTLKVQAEKTLKYRSLREAAFESERDIHLLRLKQFRDERENKTENLKKRTEERDAARAQLDNVSQSLRDNLDVVNSLEAELVESQKNLFGFAKEKQGLEDRARLLNEQREECKSTIGQNESRERLIKIKIEELLADAEEQDAVVRDLRKKVADIEQNILAFEQNITLASSQIGENDSGIRASEAEIIKIEEKRSSLEQNLETITDDIVSALDKGLKDAGYSSAERRRTQDALEDALGKLKITLAGREALLHDLADAAGRALSVGVLPKPEDIKRIAESLAAALGEAASGAENALTLFEAYRKSTPAFIDDFLAPEGIITKKRSIDGEIRAAKDAVGAKRELIARLREENGALGVKINEYRATLNSLRESRAKMSAQAVSAEEQGKLIRRELSGQEALLKTIEDELFLARKRFDEVNDRISGTEEEIAELEDKGKKLSANMEKLEKDIAKRNSDVSGTQSQIHKQTEGLAKLNTNIERLHLELAQSETEIKNIQDNFREAYSRDLMEFEELMYKITVPIADLREKRAEVKRSLDSLGSVNFMAPEEFIEVKERYDHITTQVDDLTKAKDDLEKVVAEIRAESSAKFMASYNKIKKNFHNMFRRLFGGGGAELRLVDPNHVLESGIEIYAQPPGKKLENITLLSGGEKSMTAVALLFATYMVRPSPFCLLDEIDAALDEGNVSRFVQLLCEFGRTSQFIVITHNKKTVVGAGALIGITMQEKGVTKMIEIKLENKEEAERQAFRPEADGYQEEDVEPEEGRELPPNIDDPSKVSEEELHPIRSQQFVP
ncbi:MAG: AAA family ATPase [Spirochaetaceae bacterium]|jgi:chromosome segregation protein|nr:AAA family ATPase [Spirochaetaceae bacterium]